MADVSAPSVQVEIPATDGYPLTGTLFTPEGGARGTVIFNPGLGLRARLYRRMAAYLCESGFRVLTYDYRGMGGSRKESVHELDINLLDWGRLDFGGVLRHALATWPHDPVKVVAHSTGGLFTGLVPEAEHIDSMVFVGAQHGYWALWPGLGSSALIFAITHMIVPGAVRVFGYLPARRFGWGDDCPGRLATDWARWMRHPDYVFGFPDELGEHFFANLSARILWFSVDDDRLFAPRPTVDAMVARFPSASVTREHLIPANCGVKSLGHSGAFLETCRDTVWRKTARWLASDAGSGGDRLPK